MSDAPLLQEALDLAGEVIKVQVVATIHGDDDWHRVAFPHLTRSQEALVAVYLFAEKSMLNPANILVRHLFELGVNLKYMDGHPERVADYLNHSGGLGLTLHKSAWERVSVMCEELKLEEHYDTVYRMTSDISHGGSYGMRAEVARLAGYTSPQHLELTKALWTGLCFHGWVVDINCQVFPDIAAAFGSFQPGTAWYKRLEVLGSDLYEQMGGFLRAQPPAPPDSSIET